MSDCLKQYYQALSAKGKFKKKGPVQIGHDPGLSPQTVITLG